MIGYLNLYKYLFRLPTCLSYDICNRIYIILFCFELQAFIVVLQN